MKNAHELDEAKGCFASWMSHPNEEIKRIRIAALRGALARIGRDRISSCTETERRDLAQSLAVPLRNGGRATPGPTFSTTEAEALSKATGFETSVTLRFLKGEAEGKTVFEIADTVRKATGFSLFGAAEMVRKMSAAYHQMKCEAAKTEGHLWMIRGAMYPGYAVLYIHVHGDEDAANKIEEGHPNTFGWVEKTFIGDLNAAKAHASTLLTTDEFTLKIIHPEGDE